MYKNIVQKDMNKFQNPSLNNTLWTAVVGILNQTIKMMALLSFKAIVIPVQGSVVIFRENRQCSDLGTFAR